MRANPRPVLRKAPWHGTLRAALWAGCVGVLAGCASAWQSPLEVEHPLVGRIWDPRSGQFVTRASAIARAVASPIVILGEAHDNPDHHRLQASVLGGMLEAGRRPVLAMEQFDQRNQPALDAARARGERDPEQIADAAHFDRRGWDWAYYKPLLELATGHHLELRAANLSREDARALMRSGNPAPGLPAASAALRATLEKDIIDGHCGQRPPARLLTGMVEAQRARDAQMAASLRDAADAGAVLIAGAGHARRNRAVPVYLPAAKRGDVLSIAFVEVEAGSTDPRDYSGTVLAPDEERPYDLIWFTPRAAREDPCRTLQMPGRAATR